MKGETIMVELKLPEKSVRNLFDYINEFIDNCNSQKFLKEAIKDKMRIKKAIRKNKKLPPRCRLNEFRLKDVV
jgi:hypothetical protein